MIILNILTSLHIVWYDNQNKVYILELKLDWDKA